MNCSLDINLEKKDCAGVVVSSTVIASGSPGQRARRPTEGSLPLVSASGSNSAHSKAHTESCVDKEKQWAFAKRLGEKVGDSCARFESDPEQTGAR